MFTPPNMSHVTYHVSRVMCHVSRVTCHMSHIYIFFLQSGEISRWRLCYQRGLPRLVSSRKGFPKSLGFAPPLMIHHVVKSDFPRDLPRANLSRQRLRLFHCLSQTLEIAKAHTLETSKVLTLATVKVHTRPHTVKVQGQPYWTAIQWHFYV